MKRKNSDVCSGLLVYFRNVYGCGERNICKQHSQRQRIADLFCGDRSKAGGAFFDATWGNEYMKQILDVLDKYDVKATFFLTGNWVGKISGRCKTDSVCGARYRKS